MSSYLTERAKKCLQEKKERVKEKIEEIKYYLGQTKIKRDDTNSQFINGCQSLNRLKEELKRINKVLEEGEIVNLGHCEEVEIGARVILDYGNKELEFLVGVEDPDCPILTLDSPVGEKIIGKRVGEKINFKVDGKNLETKIKKIL